MEKGISLGTLIIIMFSYPLSVIKKADEINRIKQNKEATSNWLLRLKEFNNNILHEQLLLETLLN